MLIYNGAVEDTILADYRDDVHGTAAALKGEAHSDDTLVAKDVDLESVPGRLRKVLGRDESWNVTSGRRLI